MTEKGFRVQEHCLRSSYGIEAENWLVTNDNHSVVLNDKAEAHMVANMSNDVISELNALHEENQMLKNDISGYNANYEIIKEKQVIFISGAPFISIHEMHKILDEILHKELIRLDKEMREQ